MERQIRGCILWNRFLFFLLATAVLIWGVNSYFAALQQDMQTLSIRWDGQGLKLFGVTDGPFVITHLVDQNDRSWAALPTPLAVTDSYGAYIALEDIQKMQWRDCHNEQSSFSGKTATLTALYYRPLATEHYRELK